MIGTKPISDIKDLSTGMVLRLISLDHAGPVSQKYAQAFSDCLVTGISDGVIFLERPYAKFSKNYEIRSETFTVKLLNHYISCFEIVIDVGTGKPIVCKN